MVVELGREPGAVDSILRGLLGPPRNRFTDAAERDAYATVNPTWLASYDADANVYITVGGQLQHRSASAWVDATEVLQGGRGPQGGQGDTGPPGATFPAGQAADLVLAAVDGIAREWRKLGYDNLAAELQSRIAPLPASDNAGQALVSSGSGLYYTSSGHSGSGVTEARVEALLRAHAGLPNVHHAPPTSIAAADISGAAALRWGSFTLALEQRLLGIATGAEVNVQADWNASSGDAFILNKPTIYLPTSAVPLAESGAGAVGTAITFARADHIHPLRTIQAAAVQGAAALRWGSFTLALEQRLLGMEAGAEVNVNADWNATSGDAQILNKPATFGGPTVSASAPPSPSAGDLWFDTTVNALKVYGGTAWATLGSGGSGLNQTQVQALITAHQQNAAAHHAAVTRLPASAITSIPPDWVNPAMWDGSAETNSARIFSPNQLLDAIARETQTWAQAGNTDDIPLSKIPALTRAQLSATLQGYVDHAFVSITRSGAEIRFGQNDGTHEGLDFAVIAAAAAAATGNDRLAFSSLRGATAGDLRTLLALPAPTSGTTRYLREDNSWAAIVLPTASTDAAGIVELATDAEALAAATGERVLTPSNFAALKATTLPLPDASVAQLGTTGRVSDAGHRHVATAPHSGGNTHTQTRYLGISTDATITDAALTTGAFSTSDTDDTFAWPDPPSVADDARVYLWAAVPADTGDVTGLQQAGAGSLGLITELTQQANRTLGGVAYKVWRSTTTWPGAIGGQGVTINQAA